MFDFIGLLGSLAFAVSSWPQAYMSIKYKKTGGVSLLFMILLFSAGITSSIYAIMTKQYILLPNFMSGALGISVVLFYRLKVIRRAKRCQ